MLMRRCFLRVGVDAGTEIVAVAAFHILAIQLPDLLRHCALLLLTAMESIAGLGVLAIDVPLENHRSRRCQFIIAAGVSISFSTPSSPSACAARRRPPVLRNRTFIAIGLAPGW